MQKGQACLQGSRRERVKERGRKREKERERLNFYACKGAHTLFTGQKERDKEREGERYIKIKRERERDI